MPEGDSIRHDAATLAPRLVGRAILRAASRWPGVVRGLEGVTILSIEPVGKNLLIGLDDRTSFRVHLQMNGRWWWFAPGEPIRISTGRISLLLETAEGTAVCTGAPTVERMRTRELAVHPALSKLGPDVLDLGFDPAAAAARVPQSGLPTVAEVLLDQRVACGVGNVYKCEVLFVERQDPFADPASLDLARWTELFARAQRLMRANVDRRGPRDTTGLGRGRPRSWVYGRAGRPCLRCGTRIAVRTHGDTLPRMTWYCARCQRVGG